jgi:glycosyltransferase involved in cell wall biosynthesis
VGNAHYSVNFMNDTTLAPIKISLVTACLNAGKTIERTLRSIEAQQYPALEYIVFDGGSTDDTLTIIERYHHIVTNVVSEKDKNVADAINKGFCHATGEIFCYLNADDCFEPEALANIARAFTENSSVHVVTGGCRRVFADGSELITQVPEHFQRLMSMRNDIEQPSTFWRASAHRKAGKLDDTFFLAFDWEWWNRLQTSGAQFLVVPEVLSIYYFTNDNLTSKAGKRVIDEMYRVTKRYGPKGVADVYQFLFHAFDMRGFYDVPFRGHSRLKQWLFGGSLLVLYKIFGREQVNAYNWNWASKQIRGVVWYK